MIKIAVTTKITDQEKTKVISAYNQVKNNLIANAKIMNAQQAVFTPAKPNWPAPIAGILGPINTTIDKTQALAKTFNISNEAITDMVQKHLLQLADDISAWHDAIVQQVYETATEAWGSWKDNTLVKYLQKTVQNDYIKLAEKQPENRKALLEIAKQIGLMVRELAKHNITPKQLKEAA